MNSNPFAANIIRRDLAIIHEIADPSPIVFADTIDDNPFRIEAAILGSEQTPYENGIFLLNIELPQDYPFSPPKSVIFKRATWHPNVNEYGIFTSDLIKTQWTPAITLKILLEHISALLCVPDINTTECESTRAQFYQTDTENFNQLAREYSIKYAAAY